MGGADTSRGDAGMLARQQGREAAGGAASPARPPFAATGEDRPNPAGLIAHRRRRRRLVAVIVCAIASLALPPAYSWMISGNINPLGLRHEHLLHVALVTVCSLAVFLAAFLARGNSAARVVAGAQIAVAAYGGLGMAVMALRLYYSRPLLAVSLVVSLGLLVLGVWLRRKVAPRIVALLRGAAADEETRAGLGGQLFLIDDAEADLRHFDIVLVDFSMPLSAAWTAAVSRAMLSGAEVQHVAVFLENARGRVSIEHFNVDHLGVSDHVYPHIKHAVEFSILLVLSPLLAVICAAGAAAVLIGMGRPVLFVQERIGMGGRRFRMYKLRTMHAIAQGQAGDDAMRTPAVGRFLRRWRIDELPQAWNILRGEMSLVGPRPERPQLADGYARAMPAYLFRHLMRPGLTGWAQVRFGYASSLVETRHKLSYDLYYVKYASFVLDMRILFLTFAALLRDRSVGRRLREMEAEAAEAARAADLPSPASGERPQADKIF